MPVPVPLHTAQLKADLRRGVPKFGTFLMSRSTAVAVTLAHCGYDWLLIDAQHAPYTSAEVADHITAIRSSHLLKQQQQQQQEGGDNNNNNNNNYHALTILVRVSSYQDRAGIQFALDSGADGVLIPYINNKQELEQAVSVCYYPFQNTGDDSGNWGSNAEYPSHEVQGTRSFAYPINGGVALGMQPYLNHSKRNMLIAFQVETQSCIDNLDEILTVKGVDMAFLGPYDQCLCSGIYDKVGAAKMLDSPELDALLEILTRKCKAAGVLLGVYLGGGASRVEKYLKLGFHFISVGSDLDALMTCATERLRALPAITAKVGGAAGSYALPPSNNL